MRVSSPKQAKNGGFLHVLKADAKIPSIPPKEEKPIRQIDCAALWKCWHGQTTVEMIDGMAFHLGVSGESMEQLGAVHSPEHSAWAFPMREASGRIIGIRLRTSGGNKFCVTGSRQGLFIPECEAGKTMHVTEGPTDCAAALTMGFYSVGRPSCQGCEQMLVNFIELQEIQRVVIVSDNDKKENNYAGQRGAEKLQEILPVPSIIWQPPQKDLRAFLQDGGTRQLIQCMTKDMIWTQPKHS